MSLVRAMLKVLAIITLIAFNDAPGLPDWAILILLVVSVAIFS